MIDENFIKLMITIFLTIWMISAFDQWHEKNVLKILNLKVKFRAKVRSIFAKVYSYCRRPSMSLMEGLGELEEPDSIKIQIPREQMFEAWDIMVKETIREAKAKEAKKKTKATKKPAGKKKPPVKKKTDSARKTTPRQTARKVKP